MLDLNPIVILGSMKIAILHDFLIKLGGAERVVKVLADMFPDAPIYTLFYDEKKVGNTFPANRIVTSKLQKTWKLIGKRHRFLLHKIPQAIEEFNFSDFDIVLSSNTAYAHGAIVPTDTTHICYCHAPMRFAWDWANEYKKENHITGFKKVLYSIIMKKMRIWDAVSADRPDIYLANSKNTAGRIKKYYRLDSEVVFPPVNIERFKVTPEHDDYFLIVSTLTPYKKIDLAVSLFNKIGKKLVIIGGGSHRDYLESIAGDNVEFLGFQSDESVTEYIQNCRAFIFPGEEDFGMTPVEAMAAGKPVLGFGKGGCLETIVPGITGELFYNQTTESMEEGLCRLLENEDSYDHDVIRKYSEQFGLKAFQDKIMELVKNVENTLNS